MQVHLDFSAVGETKWYEYAVRFMFGGLITAIAGVIAKTFGPVVGGLFLAFPAIFPASATLIEKHERRKPGVRDKRMRSWPGEEPSRSMPRVPRWEVSHCSLSPS
jgi:Protein of unknown function (DUF3147)